MRSIEPSKPRLNIEVSCGTSADASVQFSPMRVGVAYATNDHSTLTVKQDERRTLVGALTSFSSRNMTSKRVPTGIVGARKSSVTLPSPVDEVVSVMGVELPVGASAAAHWSRRCRSGGARIYTVGPALRRAIRDAPAPERVLDD